MNKIFTTLLIALAIVASAIVLGYAVINRNDQEGTVFVTGSGKADFTSDLIVWEARFSKENPDLKQAYSMLDKDKNSISSYLEEKGVPAEEIIFSSINIAENTRAIYAVNGNYIGNEFVAYSLSQTFKIESQKVEKIEKLSRQITELLNEGVQLYSMPPRYYYTKLADLKIEMISKATKDARTRAETIAINSGAKLGELISADMGIFQITGQNSNEDYTWGGAFNTSDKKKSASITIKLEYKVE